MARTSRAQRPAGADPSLLPDSSEDTRGDILRESLVLFAQQGYGTTTVRDIAERVGILSGSLYAHFGSKQEILATLIEMGMRAHNDALVAAQQPATASSNEQLLALMRAHVLFHAQYATLATVVHAEQHILSAENVAPSLELRERSADLFRTVLDDGARSGVFAIDDREVATASIVSMGVRVAFWYTPSFHLPAEAVADQVAALAAKAVSA